MEETVAFGAELAGMLQAGDVLALYGDLGSGKTTLVRGVARGLGVPETCEITSPTFVLLNIYPGRMPVYHFDLYRLAGAPDLYDLGFEEYFFGRGVALIEWAEKAEILLPESVIRLRLTTVDDKKREIEFDGRKQA
jgi:tRNA threonylcarbamoyladenosine biosynthesis protein TsaE